MGLGFELDRPRFGPEPILFCKYTQCQVRVRVKVRFGVRVRAGVSVRAGIRVRIKFGVKYRVRV